MSSRKDDNNEFAAIFMIFALIAAAIAAYYVLLALILTTILTIACLCAWNTPQTFDDRFTIFPEEAREFVIRGLICAVIAVLFSAIGVWRWGWKIEPNAWWVIAIGGYVAGSLGLEVLRARELPDGTPDIFPLRTIPVPPPPVIEAEAIDVTPPDPKPAPEPFRFAEWDDGEASP
ncbi:MAG: hypothetical protein QM698_08585 [Micropepsaceae bacterium]